MPNMPGHFKKTGDKVTSDLRFIPCQKCGYKANPWELKTCLIHRSMCKRCIAHGFCDCWGIEKK